LIYSTDADRPSSCNRTVDGSLTYVVLGWSAERQHVAFLVPMTIINLTSLFLIIMAMVWAGVQIGSYDSNPTDIMPLSLAEYDVEPDDPTGWKDRLKFCKERSQLITEKLDQSQE